MSDSWFRFGFGPGPSTAAAPAAAYPAGLTVMQLRHGTQSILEFGAGIWTGSGCGCESAATAEGLYTARLSFW